MSALSLSSVLSCLAWAGDSSRSLPEQKWGGHIELEVKKGNERALQETELFIPLQQDSRSLLFLNARGVFDDQHSKEGNVGLGYRAMLETPFLGQDWIAGIYGFADLRRSPNDNNFMQATVGAELLSEDYDLRLNAYIPHAKEQEISGTNNVTGTLAGTQLRLVGAANQRERALPGFDAEVGVKLPLLADYVSSMRAYGGGFYFDADGYDRVAGPRGRFEVSWDDFVSFGEGSRFTLGTEIQHDDVRGRTAFASARLRIPLQSFKKSQTVKRALSPLERRMTERVVRDVDIVSNVRTGDPVNEPATITINGQQISNVTVLDANDNLAVDIPAAGAGSTVLLDGSAGTITVGATISPAANQNVVGADVELTGADTGFTGVIGTRPALTAPGLVLFRATQPGVTLQNIDMTNVDYGISNNAGGAANFTARNLNISNAATAGILHFFTGGATYENISILDSSNGIALLNVPNSTFTNITLGGTGMVSPLWDLGGSSGNVYRNITVLNATNHALSTNSSNVTFDGINVLQANFSGITVGSATGLSLSNANISNTGSIGIFVSASTSATLSNLNISNAGLHGLVVSNSSNQVYNSVTVAGVGVNGFNLSNVNIVSGSGNTSSGAGGVDCSTSGVTNSTLLVNGASCP